jgi:hypothetical protein
VRESRFKILKQVKVENMRMVNSTAGANDEGTYQGHSISFSSSVKEPGSLTFTFLCKPPLSSRGYAKQPMTTTIYRYKYELLLEDRYHPFLVF